MDINVMACLNGHVREDDADWRCIHLQIVDSEGKRKTRFSCDKGNNPVADSPGLPRCEHKETA